MTTAAELLRYARVHLINAPSLPAPVRPLLRRIFSHSQLAANWQERGLMPLPVAEQVLAIWRAHRDALRDAPLAALARQHHGPMPLDDTLPPSRLPTFPALDQILTHFPAAFDIRVDTEGLDLLPPLDRQRQAGARPPEPPEAVLLDRVLQLVPSRLLRGVERIVVLPTRGTARPGGYLNGAISIGVRYADMRRPDAEYGNRFSVFTTTIAHEIGHAIFETVLSADEQYRAIGDYAAEPRGLVADQLLDADIQHYFIDFFIPALLGHGQPPRTAGMSRRKLAEFGLDLRRP